MTERDERRIFNIAKDANVPVGPGARSNFDVSRLDFGHHKGRTIRELAEVDPDYLRWLARHPSAHGIDPRSHVRWARLSPTRVTGSAEGPHGRLRSPASVSNPTSSLTPTT